MTRATLEEVWDEMGKGAITEAALHDATNHLDGLCDYGSQRVYVNPKPSTVETLLHELIHRRWPRWGERRVDYEAKRLLSMMSHAEVAKWYRRYQIVARKRKSPRVVEDE